MLLTDVKTIWGRSQPVRSLPILEDHFDVVFVPFAADQPLEQDRHWGIYTRGGQPIEASGYHRGHHRGRVSGGEFAGLDVANLPEAPAPHYVYGGPVINHFGHFILTSLARFWFLRFHDLAGPILCHSHGSVRDWFALDYRVEFWRGLGLGQADFATFDGPTRIRRLSIPRVGLEEQNFVHTVFGQMCRGIGDVLAGGDAPAGDGRPVYLSKHRMLNGVTKIGNEDEIIAVLEREGIEIVCPETLSIAEQIRLFRDRQTILGTSTSAFHMSVFSGRANDIFCLLPSDLLNSNFLLVDTVAGNRSRYLCPRMAGAGPVAAGGYNSYSVIEDPRGVAEELIARSR